MVVTGGGCYRLRKVVDDLLSLLPGFCILCAGVQLRDPRGQQVRPLQSDKKPSQVRRKRPGLPYVVLEVLLYGVNSSVQWQGYGRCLIRTTPFANAIGTENSYIIKAFRYMKKHRMLLELEVSTGFIQCQVRPPRNRECATSQGYCWKTSPIDTVPPPVQTDPQDPHET